MKKGLLPQSDLVSYRGNWICQSLALVVLVMGATLSVAASDWCPIQANPTQTNATCFDGSDGTAQVNPTGGTAPYAVQWSTGAAGSSITGLAAGNYQYSITDATGCAASGNIFVGRPAAILANLSRVNNTCRFNTNGVLTLAPSGGTPPYTYAWSNGATSAAISGLAAGAYSYTITDSRGCLRSGSVSVLANDPVIGSVTVGDASCYGEAGGSAALVASGGAPPYTYAWSNGATSQNVANLMAGAYTFTITDSEGCTGSGSFAVQEPAPVWTTFTQQYACFGENNGSAEVMANGGTPPYSYQWSTGATTAAISNLSPGMYFYTVTDSRGCTSTTGLVCIFNSQFTATATANSPDCASGADGSANITVTDAIPPVGYAWSNGATTASVHNLSPGTYGYTVTDVFNCAITGSVSVAAGTIITASVTQLPGGNLQASGSGGTAPYTYAWSNGETGAVATQYTSGTYSVTVTDANGCFDVASGTVVVQDPCVGVVVVATVTELPGGNIQASGSGGTAPYTYAWSNGETGAVATQYTSGTYSVTVTDANGCFDVASGTVVTVETCPGNVTYPGRIGVDQYLCAPGNTPATIGEIEPASGGTGDLEYLWMQNSAGGPFNPNFYYPIPNSNSPTYSPGPLTETTYFIRCTRRAGCVFLETNTVVITVGNEIEATIERPAMGCAFQTQTYSAGNVLPGAVVTWQFNGPVTVSATTGQSVQVTFVGAGYLDVAMTVTQNGCTGTFTNRVVIGSCFADNNGAATALVSDLSSSTVFPNPVSDWATLDLGRVQATPTLVRVYNATQNLVATYNVPADARLQDLNLSGQPAGLYLVQIVGADQKVQTLKLIKN
jgi:hypothetical protein